MKLFTESKILYEEEGNYKMPSMQEIDNGAGMVTLYRVAFKNQLESLFKYGYNRAFTGTKGGNMYGPGVYCTFKLSDTIHNVKTKPEYGDCIVSMRLIGGFDKFIIFDENLARQTYGNAWKIKDQLVNVAGFDERTARETEYACSRESDLYHTRTAPAAYYIWRKFRHSLFKNHGVKGLIYKGNRDGHCALPYEFSAVIPYAVSFDQGKTFQKKFNNELYNFIKDHTDVEFRFGGKFEEVSQSVRGFTMVKNNSGKYNIIQNETNKEISNLWFDEVDGQINPESGIFGFTCNNIHFYGSIFSPENGVIGCILDPIDNEPYCYFSDLKDLVADIKNKGYSDFEDYYQNEEDDDMNETKNIVKQLIENIVKERLSEILNEEHLKVVDNISEIIDLIGQYWTSPDDMWWINIDSRKKDFRNFNKRETNKHNQKWFSRVNRTDGTHRENHVGYVLVRGRTKEAAQNSLRNCVVHLNPWAADMCGTDAVYSNGNAEALKIVCNRFFARSYITINKRSIKKIIRISRLDKTKGLFKGREFHHRAGQIKSGIDSSGVDWGKEYPLGLIDCDIDIPQAHRELENYLSQNNVHIIKKRQSHDGMHYIVPITDVQGLDFSFMDKYATNNRPGDPNVLFKPDAKIPVYSAIG